MRRKGDTCEQDDQNKGPYRHGDGLRHPQKMTGFPAKVNPAMPQRSELTAPQNVR
jgi:hypothetical protein